MSETKWTPMTDERLAYIERLSDECECSREDVIDLIDELKRLRTPVDGKDLIVTYEISIGRDGTVHNDTRPYDSSFADVYRAFHAIKKEVDRQIAERRNCPFNPLHGLTEVEILEQFGEGETRTPVDGGEVEEEIQRLEQFLSAFPEDIFREPEKTEMDWLHKTAPGLSDRIGGALGRHYGKVIAEPAIASLSRLSARVAELEAEMDRLKLELAGAIVRSRAALHAPTIPAEGKT